MDSQTKKKKIRTGLSNIQTLRFGGLIAVLGGRKPYNNILEELNKKGLITEAEGIVKITEEGRNETERLATLAGIPISSIRD